MGTFFIFWMKKKKRWRGKMEVYWIYIRKNDLTTTTILTSKYNVESFVWKHFKRKINGVFSFFFYFNRRTSERFHSISLLHTSLPIEMAWTLNGRFSFFYWETFYSLCFCMLFEWWMSLCCVHVYICLSLCPSFRTWHKQNRLKQ